MMNKRIRSMVDEIFSEMKMTAENLALRDELMANAQARYEDSVAQGKSEEEAFVEVAASLEDVCGLLEEMKRMDEQQPSDAPQEETVPELKTGTEEDEETADEDAGKDAGEAPQTDLGDALNKASLCGLGQTASNPVRSTLRYFMDEYMEHINDKKCRAGKCSKLVTYKIDAAKCKGCTMCARKCPAGAISGTLKTPHVIDPAKCVKCGACEATCKFGAISHG